MGNPLVFARSLKYYKRLDVQQAHVAHALNREVSPRYGEGFGKRPDILSYPNDLMEFAKRKATSFHCSEERWRDPMAIQTGMSRKQLDELRRGWDLVLDIDCPFWNFSKLTAYLFIKALKDHNITAITCKFSGNKGFHIGVPFEAFPETYNDQLTKDLFPEAPRAIAQYLLDYIEEKFVDVKENEVTFASKLAVPFAKLQKMVGEKTLLQTVCPTCHKERKQERITGAQFVCANCQHRDKGMEEFKKCVQCGSVMERFEQVERGCQHCASTLPTINKFNVSALIEVDTVLLASRHLFRMAYSLHEKSGLASVVINPDTVLKFEKKDAHPDKLKEFPMFLDRSVVVAGEATELFGKAMIHYTLSQQQALEDRKKYEVPEEAIGEEFFPPCINNILAGLRDGKKRSLFILTNFLYSCGWSPKMIKDRVYDWNENNPEKLREVILKGHLQLKEKKKEIVLPPNCVSDYYKGIGICAPDDFCKAIKNPAQYAIKKHRLANFRKDGKPKAKRQPLTEEQKEMRRKYREKMKKDSTEQS